MNPAAYAVMAEIESGHWWFCGKRAILSRVINSLALSGGLQILEVGCGTGGNLDMLASFGAVSAFEVNDTAREIAFRKTNARYEIRAGSCPDQVPFPHQSFDLICLFDVLEHIEQDIEALIVLRRLLKPDGRMLITVPAYQWLYTAHDEFLHHKRRYSIQELRRVVQTSGFSVMRITYFNTLLAPAAMAMRLVDKMAGKSLAINTYASGIKMPPAFINECMARVLGFERFLLSFFNMPFGLSLLCVLKANND